MTSSLISKYIPDVIHRFNIFDCLLNMDIRYYSSLTLTHDRVKCPEGRATIITGSVIVKALSKMVFPCQVLLKLDKFNEHEAIR